MVRGPDNRTASFRRKGATINRLEQRYDIVVVGGRVAAAAAAINLARRGYRILLIERASMPSDTLSTHYLWPDGVAALDRLGVLDEVLATGTPPIRHFQSWDGEDRLVADFVEIDGFDFGLCPRRTVLDGILFERAASMPEVDAFDRTAALQVIWSDGRVSGLLIAQGGDRREIEASLVVGADGRYSTIAEEVEAEETDVTPPGRFWYYAYFEGAAPPEPLAFIVSSTETDFIGSAATNDNLQMVLYGRHIEQFQEFREDYQRNFLEAVRAHPVGERMLASAVLASPVFGMPGIRGYFREPYGPGWVLVGDAVHQKDPIAGRGINEALREAEWLAEGLANGISESGLQHYAEAMRASTWPKYELSRIVVRPDLYRTDEQAAILGERVVSDEGLTEYLRMWYDDRLTFDQYFGNEALGGMGQPSS